MKSLTYKLAMIFLIMSAVALVIGAAGAFTLQSAGRSLDDNNKALQNLSSLLKTAGDSLSENVRLQESASQVTSRIASAQVETYATLKEMNEVMLPKSFAIAQMRFALAEIAASERALLLALNMRHLEENELQATRLAQLDNISQAMRTMTQAIGAYDKLLQEGDDRQAWARVKTSLDDWRSNHEDFMAEIANLDRLVDDLIRGGPLFASASRKAYDTAFVKGKSIRETCEKGIEALNRSIARTSELDVAKAMEAQTRSRVLVQDLDRESVAAAGKATDLSAQINDAGSAADSAAAAAATALAGTSARFWYLVALSVVGIAATAAFGIVLSLRISRPVRKMAEHMSLLAMGNLNHDVPEADCARGDEIGQLARAMRDLVASNRQELRVANAMANGDYTGMLAPRSREDELGRALATMVRTTNATLSQVSRTVERVGDGAAAVSGASRSLSQGAQTSASALEEIAQTVSHVDAQARENAGHARQANELAIASRDAARRGYDAVSELVAAMGEIQNAGQKIASVVKLIDDIAFQTNLLALNAAVEAARAGRQGKGFSVVADEVRNLSGRSAKAARETGAMVAAMTERMEAGAQLAERSDQEFREIVEATQQVAQLFEEIAAASNAQSTAMAQISQGVSQIDSVIQENTDNAGRTATSALSLSRQAEKLRAMVSRFRLLPPPDAADRSASLHGAPPLPPRVGAGVTRLLSGPDAGESGDTP